MSACRDHHGAPLALSTVHEPFSTGVKFLGLESMTSGPHHQYVNDERADQRQLSRTFRHAQCGKREGNSLRVTWLESSKTGPWIRVCTTSDEAFLLCYFLEGRRSAAEILVGISGCFPQSSELCRLQPDALQSAHFQSPTPSARHPSGGPPCPQDS